MKRNAVLIAVLLAIPISYCLTLEELIDSYDFSYTDGTVDILDIDDYMLNSTVLVVNVTFESAVAGNYDFTAGLARDRQDAFATGAKYFPAGISSIQLKFDARLLSDGDYNLTISIEREGIDVFEDTYPLVFDSTGYAKPEFSIIGVSHFFVDNNSDGLYEKLNVSLSVNSTISANKNITIYFTDGEQILTARATYLFNIGDNALSIASELDNTMESMLLYQISIGEYLFEYDYEISDYNASIIYGNKPRTLSINETAVDIDDDGSIDYLKFDFKPDIYGNYTLTGKFSSVYDEFIQAFLATDLTVIIEGADIYSKKINGPFLLHTEIEGRSFDHITQYYTYDKFEKPGLADLSVKIAMDNFTVNITLINIGEAPAFSFFVEVFDNYSIIDSRFFASLFAGDSITWAISNNNYTSLAAITDFRGNIDESNKDNNYFLFFTDEDEDGFGSGDDCNDTNALVNPHAIELCNAIDDNCDNIIDEGYDSDADDVTDCFDNCNLYNPLQEDFDADRVGDRCDLCNNTSIGESVDNSGCSDSQFCRKQGKCGAGCDGADWKDNEQGIEHPKDCRTVIIVKEGNYEPMCAGTECAD